MAPQYTQRDLAWYTGMMLGMAGVYVLLDQTGIIEARIAKLIVAGLCGVALGWATQTMFDRAAKK